MRKPTKTQILNWIKKNFHDYKIRKNGNEVLVPNPLYHNDKLKLNISLIKAVVHDWRTDAFNYSFIQFVSKYKNISWKAAWKEVTSSVYIPNKKESQDDLDPDINIELPETAYPIENLQIPQMRTATINYMSSRGIGYDRLVKNHVYYGIGEVIFPYIEFGEIVYWQSRSIVDKIFNFPPNSQKENFIYGIDNCNFKGELIIVESIIDAITIDDNTLAIGGSSISKQQLKKIQFLEPEKIIVAPDNDKAGRNMLKQAFFKLKKIINEDKIYYVFPPKEQDWNDLRENALDYIQNYIQKLTRMEILLNVGEK